MKVFAQLAEKAEERGIQFLVIGGHAVAHHHYPRTTEDTDLLICKDDRDAWLQLTGEIGLQLFNDGGDFLQFEPPESSGWRLDLTLVNASTFARMRNVSESNALEGRDVRLPSLFHLIALKLHALKHASGIRVLKDMDDVANLFTNNQIDVKYWTNFANWFLNMEHRNSTKNSQVPPSNEAVTSYRPGPCQDRPTPTATMEEIHRLSLSLLGKKPLPPDFDRQRLERKVSVECTL